MKPTRRSVLRTAGAALALPWLEALAPRRLCAADPAVPAGPARRLVCIYVPHGVNNPRWYPTDAHGQAWTPSPSLQPLAPRRAQTTVLTGLGHPRMPDGSAHAAAARWLAGVHPDDRGINANDAPPVRTESMDQTAARHLGAATRFPSLQVAVESGIGWPARSTTLAFSQRGLPLPALSSPQQLFQRLFVPETAGDQAAAARRQAQRRSLLDDLAGEVRALDGGLGRADRDKLGEYLEAVREVERQIERDAAWAARPKPQVDGDAVQAGAKDRSGLLRTYYDLAALALRTDSTRVITVMAGVEVDGYDWHELGFKRSWHDLQHHNGEAAKLEMLAKVDTRNVELLAGFLDRLAALPEDGASVLDRTLVLYGSGMNNGKGLGAGTGVHGTRKLPLLLAGGSALGIRQGRHLVYPDDRTPLCRLHVSLLRALGVPCERFMDGDGPLADLA